MKTNEEFGLVDFGFIIWRKKWWIILPTLFLVLLAGGIGFILPQKWEVASIIQPGKFYVEGSQGRLIEILLVTPEEIKSQVVEGAFDQMIAAELGLEPQQIPKVKAKILSKTNLIKLFLVTTQVKKGQRVLEHLFKHLADQIDGKIKVEVEAIDTQKQKLTSEIETWQAEIQQKKNEIEKLKNMIAQKNNKIEEASLEIESLEIQQKGLKERITLTKNKMKISGERVNKIKEELAVVQKRIANLEKLQEQVLAQLKEQAGSEALGLLLYANEIQNNLRYLNELNKELSQEKVTQEDLKSLISEDETNIEELTNQIEKIKLRKSDLALEINKLKAEQRDRLSDIEKIKASIASLEKEINFLENKKNRYDFTSFIMKPTSSLQPVFPRRNLIIVVAFFVGFFVFSFLAFFAELIEFRKRERSES